MRRRFTVFRPTIIEAMRVRPALNGLEAVVGTSGAVAERGGDVLPRALGGIERGKGATFAVVVALAVRHRGARAGARE